MLRIRPPYPVASLVVLLAIAAGCGTSPRTGDAAGIFGCPVTTPNDYTPSQPYPTRPASPDLAWHGDADLWTALPAAGRYVQRKSVWWSAQFEGGHAEPMPEISVRWERLDADADPIDNENATNAFTSEDGWFMIAGFDPGITGCWRVTATYAGATLGYVFREP